MPTAADGSVLGDDAKLYFSATLGGSGTLTEVPVVIDDTIGSERRTAESNCRGDSEISEHVGKPKHTISGTILHSRQLRSPAYHAHRWIGSTSPAIGANGRGLPANER